MATVPALTEPVHRHAAGGTEFRGAVARWRPGRVPAWTNADQGVRDGPFARLMV